MNVDVSRAALECPVMSRAHGLAAWIGSAGRPVTAKGVLRRTDIAEAGRAIEVDFSARVRTAADIVSLHHPWVAAQAAGLLVVDGSRAVAGPGMVGDAAQAWRVALEAVLRDESSDKRRRGASIACQVVLAALATDPPPAPHQLVHAMHVWLDDYGVNAAYSASEAFRNRGVKPTEAVLALLAEFGAVDDKTRLTPLGHWALDQLRTRTKKPVSSALTAAELLTRLAAAPEDEWWPLAMRWSEQRSMADTATELLRAAAAATPAERVAAVDVVASMGDEAIPAWQAALDSPNLAAHACALLAEQDLGPEPDDAQQRWLAVECAVAALSRDSVEDVYDDVCGFGGLAIVETSAHPDAATLREAVVGFFASGQGPRMYQLKIALTRVRGPVWRRVLMPASATLGDLHLVIRRVLGWDGDHLHEFTADGENYSNPYYNLEEHRDESLARLSRVLPRKGATIGYVYDFGDWWEHRITLEKNLDAYDGPDHPTCVAGQGDNPVEDWNPEYPESPTPFDRDAINDRLAELTGTTPAP